MNNITISRDSWKATYSCIGVNDTRRYLNGACLDCDAKRIIGTDGSVLMSAPLECDNGMTGQYILPPVKGVKLGKYADPVEVHINADNRTATVNGSTIVELIDEKPPNYASIARHKDGDCAQIEGNYLVFNPQLIARVTVALAGPRKVVACKFIPGAKPNEITGNASMPMRVFMPQYPDIEVTLMPCRV